MGQKSGGNIPEAKSDVREKLRRADEIFVIISNCTNLPYVMCDEQTYDDEIFVFYRNEDAQKFGRKLIEEKNPVQIARLDSGQFLGFYSMLYTVGVNCIKTGKGTDEESSVQLSQLVTRKEPDKAGQEIMYVENPELHLTAVYLMQKFRSGQTNSQEELLDIQEEMLIHFKEGQYIAALQEDGGTPLLKQESGDIYQPLFTDMAEFLKFNQKNKFRTAVVEYDAVAGMLAPESKGVVLNPFGVNVQLEIKRN